MINKCLKCSMPCDDVNKNIIFPIVKINPVDIKLIMISEAPSANHSDYFYMDSGSFFKNTQAVFADAGIAVSSYDDLTKLQIYLTTAIKCSKKDYLVSAGTINECSKILEQELDQFSNVKVIMCMGDFAIKAMNYIWKRKYNVKAIPTGSTYKIRKQKHESKGIRFFPSYTHTGDSFGLEKSKVAMISEDVKSALSLIK